MSFGIFDSLAQYGILGFAVLALGYLCWIFLNRLMKSEEDYRQRVEELEANIKHKLREQFKDYFSTTYSKQKETNYFILRFFCIETGLLTFNEIELMEYEYTKAFI